MLSVEELEVILDTITEKVTRANRLGELNELLRQWGFDDLIDEPIYDTYKEGKIVVIGATEVKEKDLIGIINSLGIDKNRFEFCLDYNEAKSFNFSKLRYNPGYRLVLAGPMPHSSKGKGDSSSAIAEMQNQQGYPKVVALSTGNELKLSKSSFKIALENALRQDYI